MHDIESLNSKPEGLLEHTASALLSRWGAQAGSPGFPFKITGKISEVWSPILPGDSCILPLGVVDYVTPKKKRGHRKEGTTLPSPGSQTAKLFTLCHPVGRSFNWQPMA